MTSTSATSSSLLSLPQAFNALSTVLNLILPPLVAYSFYVVFMLTPNEREMGIIQKVFYYHLPMAIGSFVFFLLVGGASIAFLVNGKKIWDTVAHASAEVGMLSGALACLTGSMWARGSWGVYWTMDPRLTTMLIMLFIFIGYLTLRSSAEHLPNMRSLAAVTGVIGSATVPLVYFSVHIWNTIHPVVITPERNGLAPEIQQTLSFTFPLGIAMLFAVWLMRMRLLVAEDNMFTLKTILARREDDADV